MYKKRIKVSKQALTHAVAYNDEGRVIGVISLFAPRTADLRVKYRDENKFHENNCYDCPFYSSNHPEEGDDDYEDYDYAWCNGGLSLYDWGDCYQGSHIQEDSYKVDTTITVDIPPYIMFVPFIPEESDDDCYIYALDETKDGLRLIPLLIGNVYESGKICWGDEITDRVRIFQYHSSGGDIYRADIAHTVFWESESNSDLVPNEYDDISDWLEDWSLSKIHKSVDLDAISFDFNLIEEGKLLGVTPPEDTPVESIIITADSHEFVYA